jgi:energy-coupling factor transporter ATP-binding protein EcfA2
MPLLSEKKPLDAHRVLITGRSGSGKSELLGTYYKAGGVAIASCDRDGVDVMLAPGFRSRYPDFDPNTVHYEQFEEPTDEFGVPTNAKAVWEVIKYINSIAKQWPKYRTLGVDSMTMLSIWAAHAGMQANAGKNKSKTWSTKDAIHMLLGNEADIGAEQKMIAQIMAGLMKFPGHIIVTAHIREERTKEGILTGIQPLLTGNVLRGQIANWFREVWFLDTVDVPNPDAAKPGQPPTLSVRLLQTQPSGLVKICKTLGVPNRMVNPSFTKIQRALAGESSAISGAR